MNKFKNIISLGFFCSPALEIKRIGLRNASYPFDWLITPNLQTVLFLIENNFIDFLSPQYFYQFKNNLSYYKNVKYDIDFYHDFDPCISFSKQIKKFTAKYSRRFERFYQTIALPTLFIRYVSDSNEIKYIEENYNSIIKALKKYNNLNDIIFVANSDIAQKCNIDIWMVYKDTNDVVSRKFLDANKELRDYILSKVECNNQNTKDYFVKKKSIIYRGLIKIFHKMQWYYHHNLQI